MLVVASIALVVGILAHHLGLADAVARVMMKIAKCVKCLVFWLVLTSLVFCHYNLLCAVGVALISSYLSHWLGLLLMWLAKIYNKIWERLNK